MKSIDTIRAQANAGGCLFNPADVRVLLEELDAFSAAYRALNAAYNELDKRMEVLRLENRRLKVEPAGWDEFYRLTAENEQLKDERRRTHEQMKVDSQELETVRMKLALCGAVATMNTEESRKYRLERGDQHHSNSYELVCRAVDREMAAVARNDELLKRIDELKAKCRASEQDAARYRWLRHDAVVWRTVYGTLEVQFPYVPISEVGPWLRVDIDAAVDKAMNPNKVRA